MNDDREVELSPAERSALEALREGPAPPGELETRVVAVLAAEGLLGPRREPAGARAAGGWRRLSLAAGIAASLAAFGLGWWTRGATPAVAGPETAGDRYVLLLHETGRALPASEEARLVAEYSAWAVELRRQGVVIDGEKLDEPRWLLGPGGRREERGPTRGALAGYFLLDAADAAAALALAETCPHLRHGGSVELRRIAVRGRG